jgi:hypothetical protein
MVIDQSSDPVMAHLSKRVDGRPKLAAALGNVDVNAGEIAALPDDAFAWPEKRAFPVHDAGHALMSCVYREGLAGVPKYVDDALKEACEVYGVDTKLLAREKVATAQDDCTDDYLLPDIKRLRVTNSEQVKVAEERLRTEGKTLTLEHRATASARLVQKAAAMAVPLRAETLKMAGLVATDTRQTADWLEARAEAAPHGHKDGYVKMAAAVRKMPAELRDRAEQMKLADAVYDLDQLSGIDRYWQRKLPDPMATVFNTEKIAGAGVNLAGRFIPMARLASYDSGFYGDVLGDDIIREASDGRGGMDVHKLADVLQTLPADMQRVLSQHIR